MDRRRTSLNNPASSKLLKLSTGTQPAPIAGEVQRDNKAALYYYSCNMHPFNAYLGSSHLKRDQSCISAKFSFIIVENGISMGFGGSTSRWRLDVKNAYNPMSWQSDRNTWVPGVRREIIAHPLDGDSLTNGGLRNHVIEARFLWLPS